MPGRYARHATLIPLLVLLTLVLSGCGGGNQSAGPSGQAQPTQEPQRTGTEPAEAAAQVPTSPPVPTLSPTTAPTVMPTQAPTQVATAEVAGTSTRGGGEAATIQLSAENVQFDKDSITVQKGSRVVIEFTNNDSMPHNFAAYKSEAATEEIFVGEIITGPKTVKYEFEAPSEPGTYFFRCDVHPDMTGQLVVQ